MRLIDFSRFSTSKETIQRLPRQQVRQHLKSGQLWSRLNPDLLQPGELLPYISVQHPPSSSAELVPFPVSTQRYQQFSSSEQDITEFLVEEKIHWCNKNGRPLDAIYRSVQKQMKFYYATPSTQGSEYSWITFDPQHSPYRPLLEPILASLGEFSQANPQPPQPMGSVSGEAWHTPQADAYGVKLFLSTQVKGKDLQLSIGLYRSKYFWFANYVLAKDRYTFVRQQLFYLLAPRVKPWLDGSSYRGRIYRKPKK